jgi:hypothetical protein
MFTPSIDTYPMVCIQGAQSNREGFRQLGVEVAEYTTLVGRAVRSDHASSVEQTGLGAPNTAEGSLSVDQNDQLRKTKEHIVKFAEYVSSQIELGCMK